MKNKLLKGFIFLFVCLLFTFSCKHDNDGKNGQKEEKKEEKALVLSTFNVGDNAYNKQEKTILVTKSSLKEEDIKDVVFTDESGTEVKNVNWKMNPNRLAQIKADSKFKIEVKTPPKGYKIFESEEIRPIRELVPPEVTSITVHGVRADVSKQPFTVRIPKPTVATPIPGFPGAPTPEIEVRFNKDVPPASVSYEGLPADSKPLKPEDVAHATIKVAESAGKWKAGEYKLDITFDTPSLSITELRMTGQDGDTDLSEKGKISLMVENGKEKIEQSDIATVKFAGEYISQEELNKITTATLKYEGLPLNNLQVSKPQTFTIKVDAKEKVYKAFEAKVTVTRANAPLTLKGISVFNNAIADITDLNNLKTTVQTMTTFIEAKDIKAKFAKPGSSTEEEIPCSLIGGEKLALKAGVENEIKFKIPATNDYAEYRGVVKVKHETDYKHMIKLPMPADGAKWKTGLKDDKDISLNRKVEVGQFPVTYKLWKEVIAWAKGTDGQAKGYKNFDFIEKMGRNGIIWSAEDEARDWGVTGHVEDERAMPVCGFPFHAALAWCNAYSEMKGYAPVYYANKTGEIETTWTPNAEGRHDLSCQKVTVKAEKDAINKLALRDALNKYHPDHYKDDIWPNIRDNYIKVAMLTAEQAKCEANVENGFRLIDTVEYELAARLRLTGGKNVIPGATLQDNNNTYYFANKDCAAGSDGYGVDGSEIDKVAWCRVNSRLGGFLQTHPVGHKWPTDLGFYDLAGNISSWTNTWSKKNTNTDGSWDYVVYAVGSAFSKPPSSCLVTSCDEVYDVYSDITGIRLARTLK